MSRSRLDEIVEQAQKEEPGHWTESGLRLLNRIAEQAFRHGVEQAQKYYLHYQCLYMGEIHPAPAEEKCCPCNCHTYGIGSLAAPSRCPRCTCWDAPAGEKHFGQHTACSPCTAYVCSNVPECDRRKGQRRQEQEALGSVHTGFGKLGLIEDAGDLPRKMWQPAHDDSNRWFFDRRSGQDRRKS